MTDETFEIVLAKALEDAETQVTLSQFGLSAERVKRMIRSEHEDTPFTKATHIRASVAMKINGIIREYGRPNFVVKL